MQIINKNIRILIVGLGLIGGSYAKALRKKGFYVSAITNDQHSIDYALKEQIIDEGYSYVNEKAVSDAELVVFALYPKGLPAILKSKGQNSNGAQSCHSKIISCTQIGGNAG